MARRAAHAESVYTYRGGKKIDLKKRPNEFVIRQLPEDLPDKMNVAEQTSTRSTRVKCKSSELESLMEDARALAPTHHAYELQETGDSFLITDRVIVTFKDALGVEDVGLFAGEHGLEILEKISERDYLFRLTDSTGMNPVKLVVKLTEEDDRVENVDHDLNLTFNKAQLALPTDPFYQAQWHLHQRRAPSSEYDRRSSARCEDAWRLLENFGSGDVVVGVTDDGCDLDHNDFNSTGKFAGWGYFEGITLVRRGDPGAQASRMYKTGANHGTACAGVIAAETDGEMTVGAAPGCRLLPIQWPSSGNSLFIGDTRMRRALEYLGEHVDVVSNSWGSTPTTNWALTTLNTIDALAISGGRRERGVVFLWAAGNENCPISHQAEVDVPHTNGWGAGGQWAGVQTTRTFFNNLVGRTGVMHVAALASTAQRSHYSNYGTGIGICAPSSNSHAYWRLHLPGRGIVTALGGNDVRDNFGGTSSATPLVAGVAALVISANPQLSGVEVIQILKRTASKDLNLTGWPRTPPAAYNPDTSWDVSPIAPFDSGEFQNAGLPEGTWSPWFGHGKVDAETAVRRARGDVETRRITASRTADLVIPDRNPVGVVSRLAINESGPIQRIRVSLDVTHTWIGDLIVQLVGPQGQRVVLHDRAGNNTQNLSRAYDDATTPDLSAFHGTEVNGVWSLEVSDHAPADTGTLNQWSLDVDVLGSRERRFEATPGAQIPDNDPLGITSSIDVTFPGDLSDIAVEVDVTHSWRGDLVLKLDGPNGNGTVELQSREGGPADHVQRTYRPADVPDLSNFLNHSASGQWTLTVADRAGGDIGKLNRWALVLE